jgi:hypothetical protein
VVLGNAEDKNDKSGNKKQQRAGVKDDKSGNEEEQPAEAKGPERKPEVCKYMLC